jgi:hypothetical protein
MHQQRRITETITFRPHFFRAGMRKRKRICLANYPRCDLFQLSFTEVTLSHVSPWLRPLPSPCPWPLTLVSPWWRPPALRSRQRWRMECARLCSELDSVTEPSDFHSIYVGVDLPGQAGVARHHSAVDMTARLAWLRGTCAWLSGFVVFLFRVLVLVETRRVLRASNRTGCDLLDWPFARGFFDNVFKMLDDFTRRHSGCSWSRPSRSKDVVGIQVC